MTHRDDVDDALARLDAVLRPRVGKRMTAHVLHNIAQMKESGASHTALLQAIHANLDAFARIPESGTPFPLAVAKAIGDAGCLKLPALNARRGGGPGALCMSDDEARAVAAHADALLPAYGEDDAEFAVRVAWKCVHHYHKHLVVGRAFERNDPAPTEILHDAWRTQGANGIPIASVARADDEDDGGGVIYAHGETSTSVLERFRATTFSFEPDRGAPIELAGLEGLQRFFARVPLEITPHTLAWIVHLVRLAFPNEPIIDVDGALTVAWEPLEDEPHARAASLMLGISPAPTERRDTVTLRVGETSLKYARGELAKILIE